MAIRIAVLGVLAVTIFCALFFRLWALQVISGERYLENARNNQIRPYRAPAPRGSIVDRNGTVLVANVPGTLVQLWPAALEGIPETDRARMLQRLARLLELPPREVRAGRSDGRRRPAHARHHRRARRRTEDQLPARAPGAVPRRADRADAPARLPAREDRRATPRLRRRGDQGAARHDAGQGYAAGDRIGQTGVEATYDQFLRGTPGVGRVYVDALGRVTSARQFSQLPEAGNNIRLTIDAELQRAAEEALDYGIRLALDDGEWARGRRRARRDGPAQR